MMYTRASASDYDDWKTVYENPGWGSNDLIPFLRKVGALGSIGSNVLVLVLMLCPCRRRTIKSLAGMGQRTAPTAR